MSVPTPNECPCSMLGNTHKYKPVPNTGDQFECPSCNRTIQYNAVTKSWKVLKPGM